MREGGKKIGVQKKRNERCVRGSGDSELQELSLSRAALFNVSISVAPQWLKIEGIKIDAGLISTV